MAEVRVTATEFRNRQAALLARAAEGDEVIISQRGGRSYRIDPLPQESLGMPPELRREIAEAREAHRKGDVVICHTADEVFKLFDSL